MHFFKIQTWKRGEKEKKWQYSTVFFNFSCNFQHFSSISGMKNPFAMFLMHFVKNQTLNWVCLVGSFNMPVQAQTWGHPFKSYSKKPDPLYCEMGFSIQPKIELTNDFIMAFFVSSFPSANIFWNRLLTAASPSSFSSFSSSLISLTSLSQFRV